MLLKQKTSGNWSYRFHFNGEVIQKSTKQTNKRIAAQLEAAHKTQLAKGEVGIKDKTPVPTLRDFAEHDFLPFVRSTSAAKPRTVVFYENSVRNLNAYDKLAGLKMDAITSDVVAGFAARRRDAGMQVSTINRDLATLRRMFHLAQEFGKVTTVLPRVKMLPGENRRERILTADEETAYLNAAAAVGNELNEDYQHALGGIRAVVRGQEPRTPDAFLLRDVVTILADCALRPEECFRLRWDSNIRDGSIEILTGKGKGSRRRVPMSPRVLAILEMRRDTGQADGWVFPADTKSGHIEPSTLKKQQKRALALSGVAHFVMYSLRHTCLTRWSAHIDPYMLHVLAGHTAMDTTMRYVHPSDASIVAAMDKARAVEPVLPASIPS